MILLITFTRYRA